MSKIRGVSIKIRKSITISWATAGREIISTRTMRRITA